jgi:hypothetical protein
MMLYTKTMPRYRQLGVYDFVIGNSFSMTFIALNYFVIIQKYYCMNGHLLAFLSCSLITILALVLSDIVMDRFNIQRLDFISKLLYNHI